MILSPLFIKPPPGFSQEPGKEERNHYLGTPSKCSRIQTTRVQIKPSDPMESRAK